MNNNNIRSQANKHQNKSNKGGYKKREFLKTKTSEVVDYFPRDNNDEDFGFNLASMETKNSLFSSKSELLKKKRKQDSQKAKKPVKDPELEEQLDDLDFRTDENNNEKLSSRALLPNFKVGDLVLLCICEIRQTYMIANYTRNKKAMIHVNYSGFDSEKEENFSFKNYFKIGQFVCGAVVSPGNDIQLPQGYMNKKITVSIDPKIVNTGLKKEALSEGMDLWGRFVFDNQKQCYSADFGFTDAEEEMHKFNKNFAQSGDEENEELEEENLNYEGQEEAELPEEDQGLDLNESENEREELENSGDSEGPEEIEFNEAAEGSDAENNYLNLSNARKSKTALNKKKKQSKKLANILVKIIDLEKDSEYFEPEIIKSKILNSYYFFKIVKIEKDDSGIVLFVSLNPSKLKFGIKKIEFSQIRPGFLFKANLTRELLNGIEVAFAGNIGTIFVDHLKSATKKNKNFLVRVTHVSVGRKNLSLSALTHITNLHTEAIVEKHHLIGNVFENVKLEQEVYGGSFIVNLAENATGFIHKKNIGILEIGEQSNAKNNNDENNNNTENQKENEKNKNKKRKNLKRIEELSEASAVAVGAQLPLVLVKEYNYFDDHAILKSVDLSDAAVANKSTKDKKGLNTDKSELVKSNYITWQNLKVGKMLSVKIKEVHSDHLVVSVNDFITGKIPKDLLSDYHFTNIPKKFQVGNKLLCRVFKCEYETKNLQFIAKESLMDETIVLHESLESLKEGEEISVIYVGNGLFQHSGSVIGKLQNFSIYEKKEKFKIGKAYQLNIFKVNLNSRKLMLSKEKTVYLPSFGDFDVFMRRHPLLLTVANYLNADAESENEKAEKNNSAKKHKTNKQKNLAAKKTVSLDDIEEGKIYDFELIPVKKILRLLEKKGIDLNLINEDIELFMQKVLFVKLPDTNFYGFLQVELLADFFSEKEFKILYELGNKVSEILKEAEKDSNLANNPLEGLDISENKNIIKKLLVVNFDKESKVLFTSGKQSLMRFSRESLIPKSKEEIYSATSDRLYCGYVNKVNEKGIIIQFLGKFRFLIRTNKAASTENLGNETPKEFNNSNLINPYLNGLEPGQTILVAALFDKVKNKLRFLSGLELFKNLFGVNNSIYNSQAICAEAENILNDYELEFKFVSGKDKVLIELGDLNAEFNAAEYTKGQERFLEGYVGKLINEQNEININLKNHANFKAVLKIANSNFSSENLSAKEIYEKFYIQNSNVAHKFLINEIDYENEIIYLTDIFTDSTSNNSKSKIKKIVGSTQEFIVDAVLENYVSCHLAKDPNLKAMLPCNLHNFNYAKLFKNLNSKKTLNQMDLEALSEKNNLLSKINFTILPSDKLNALVKTYDENLKKFVLAAPEPELSQTVNSAVKANSNINYNNYSNSSSRKNSDFDKITSLTPGKTFNRSINGIKKNFVYIFIDKHTIGRINLQDFSGDQDQIKKLLRESKKTRKVSGNTASEGQTNTEDNESFERFNKENASLTASLLKMKFKILHVEQLEKNRKIVDLINIDENNSISKNANKEPELSNITEKTKMDGETALKGIISKIDFNSKFPIRIDYANSIEKKISNKAKSEDTAFHVNYANLKNFNFNKSNNNSTTDSDSGNMNISDLFALGEEVNFYLKKQKDGSIIPSLIPFSQLPKKLEVDNLYIVRVLKPILGRGLIVSIFDNNLNTENNNTNNKTAEAQQSQKSEAFVDINEISDEMHANPLYLYSKGQIALGRIISFDAENSKKFFVSLRQSATNNSLYDILKNGSTIKFKKYFEHYEKSGDYRNKIFKFGANQVIENNQIILGYVTASSEKGVFIKLGPDTTARAALNELSDEKATSPFLLYKQNQLVICRIIFIDRRENNNTNNNENNNANNKNSNIKISVSLRESVIKYNLTLKKRDLKQANFYECQVINESNEKFTVSVIGSTFTGVLEKSNEYLKKDAKAHKEIRDSLENKKTLILELRELDTSVFPNVIKFSNINIEDQANFDRNLVINLLSEQEKANYEINSELFNNVKMIVEKEQENELSDELKELEKETEEVDFEALLEKKDNDEENDDEAGEDETDEIIKYDDSEDEQADELILDHEIKSQFHKGLGITQQQKTQEQNDVEMKNEEEEVFGEMEVEEENNKEAKTSQHHQSSKQKAKSHLKEELKIREKEVEKKVGEYNSVEDFEKLILSDPQNSLYWIQYSAFILDNLGMDSARKIMDRAVHTVDIANLKDKMNLWIAYMNLENTYGTPERFKEVVQRALEVNNKKEIYKHLVSIYKLSDKYEMAFEVFRLCIKEYFEDVQLWKNFIEFLFEVKALRIKNESNVQGLKKLENVFDVKEGYNRCLQTLTKSKHLEIEIFYAQMQYKYGFIEEGRTSFEIILKNHPKRSDIWIVYLDKEIKIVKNPEKIRHLFEKFLTIDFKIKVLKTIIKKYLEYEKEHGNKKTIEHVMALTQKLINNKLSSLQKNEDNEQMEVDE